MSEIDLTALEVVPRACLDGATFDIAIAGAGIAGLAVAKALLETRRDLAVIVLDAGPMGPIQHLDSPSTREATAFERWCGAAADPFAFPRASRGLEWQTVGRRVVGGRGLYWGGALLRIQAEEFEGDTEACEWLETHGLSKRGDSYDRVEKLLRSVGYFDPGGERIALTTGIFASSHFATCSRAIRGLSRQQEVFTPLAMFAAASSRQAVRICTSCEVVEVASAIDGCRVNYRHEGQNYSLRAGKVVLAAGGIENGIILTRSSPTKQQEFIIEDHVVAGAAAVIPVNSELELVSQLSGQLFLAAGKMWNTFLSFTRRSPSELVIDAWGVAEADRSVPTILRLHDEGANIEFDVDSNFSIRDRSLQMQIHDLACELVATACSELGAPAGIVDETVHETRKAMRLVHFGNAGPNMMRRYTSVPGTVDHEGCIRRIGRQGPSSTSDFENVFMAGPSSFIRMGAANPTFTTLATAYPLAKELCRD